MRIKGSLRLVFTLIILGMVLFQIVTISPTFATISIVTIATDATNGISSLGTEGGQKLIQDGSVTISGRLTNANTGVGLGARTVNIQQS